MSKVYELRSDLAKYAFFAQIVTDRVDTFSRTYGFGKMVDLSTVDQYQFSLEKSRHGLKNYQSDITVGGGWKIFSEKAVEVLRDILEERGQLFPINTPSKRKKFYGFHPNKNMYSISIMNMEKSDWVQYEKGKLIRKVVLNNTYPKNDYLFTIDELYTDCFVTDKFKKLVEDNGLIGFDFSREILVSD